MDGWMVGWMDGWVSRATRLARYMDMDMGMVRQCWAPHHPPTLSVYQECYDLPGKLPEGDWYCDVCASRKATAARAAAAAVAAALAATSAGGSAALTPPPPLPPLPEGYCWGQAGC